MPPPKKGSSKKEVLPNPDALPDGKCNYYIGSWSHYKRIDDISEITNTVVEQHTTADGEVKQLPPINVLIPACEIGEAGARYGVKVSDNMHIESIPLSSMKNPVQKAADDNQSDHDENGSNVREDTNESQSPVQHDVGASSTACDAILRGALHIDGILTRIVVKPQLPDQCVVPKPPKKVLKGKNKAKILEEYEKRLAEEAEIYEKRSNEAIAAAKEEEEYRMQFAHPNRWSHVVFANMTFEGQVIVSHAHVTFQNCRFAAGELETTQLLVTQYCQVNCVRCTFVCPTKGCVYGWPMGQLNFRRCLFTGTPHPYGNLKDKEDMGSARELRPQAVGLHTDNCKVHVEGCRFTEMGTGILFRGKFPGGTAENPSLVVKECEIEHIFGTGVVLDTAHAVVLVKNHISNCDYYAFDCVKGRVIQVLQNTFLSQVRVQSGAQVKFMHNESGTVPLNLKETDNPNWQPVY